MQIALDKYNEAHIIRLNKQEDSRRFLHNNFYFVGSDGVDLFVGMFRRTIETVEIRSVGSRHNTTKYEVIKPLKRIKEFLDEHGYVLGKLVMAKVAMEDKCDTYYRDYIPRIGVYNADLDMVFNNNIVGNGNTNGNTNQYMMQYVLIPTEHNE